MLDWPAFADALWLVNDELGIRPEWQLTVLYLESRFNPASVNPYGCVGLNQFCPSVYNLFVPVPPEQYRAWPASVQLSGPIFKYWQGAGAVRSAAGLMLVQLGRPQASDPSSVVFQAPSLAYERNKSFDVAGKQYITVADIEQSMRWFAQKPEVQDAIARAYALRGRPSSRSAPQGTLVVTLSALALAAAVGYGAYRLRSVSPA